MRLRLDVFEAFAGRVRVAELSGLLDGSFSVQYGECSLDVHCLVDLAALLRFELRSTSDYGVHVGDFVLKPSARCAA